MRKYEREREREEKRKTYNDINRAAFQLDTAHSVLVTNDILYIEYIVRVLAALHRVVDRIY